MRTFPKRTSGTQRLGAIAAHLFRGRIRQLAMHGEAGFLLIEVMISAMLVALIVGATFNGFDAAGRLSADQRRHNQAAVLAAQSQEQLRSDPASALDPLTTTAHSYTQTVGGTEYTIVESAKYINDTTQTSTCATASSTEANKLSGNYLQITSVVSWTALGKNAAGKSRPKVEQSSIITPPTGSALEVDIVNGATPAEGVANIPASVEYVGVESTQTTKVSGTTDANGCVIFGSIPATTATLKIETPNEYVTPSGATYIAPEQITLAPNITTHREFTLNRGGKIEGEFFWGSTPVESDTFVAFNTKMGVSPEYLLGGSAAFGYEASGEERYTPVASTRALTATTPAHSPGYPNGDVFPWPTSKYIVYAGDCKKNSVTETLNPEARKNEEVLVSAGTTSKVKIPTAKDVLNVYTGTAASPGLLTTETPANGVQITNTECKEQVADNATKALYVHEQKLSGGHLSYPYQPFGALSVCVYSASAKRNYTVSFANERLEQTRNIYLGTTTSNTEQEVSGTNPSPAC
jgi:Tfp pilus assembly protein PilV